MIVTWSAWKRKYKTFLWRQFKSYYQIYFSLKVPNLCFSSLYKTLQIKVSINLIVYWYFSNICQVRNIIGVIWLYVNLNYEDIHEEHFSYFAFQKTELLKTEQNWWITLMRCPWENVQVQTSLLILLYTCVICKLPLKHGMQTHFFRAYSSSNSSSSFYVVVSSRF